MKKSTINIVKLSIGTLIFITLILLLKFVDVKTGFNNTELGLYSINNFFYESLATLNNKVSSLFNFLSDIGLYYAFILVFVAIIIGIAQWIKRKSIRLVDFKIISFGISLVLLAIIWIVFDRLLIINYRPNEDASSFPSTHIMIVTFVLIGIIPILKNLTHSVFNKRTYKVIDVVTFIAHIFIILLTIVGRLFSKEHWFSDALGGVIMGITLNYLAIVINQIVENRNKKMAENN